MVERKGERRNAEATDYKWARNGSTQSLIGVAYSLTAVRAAEGLSGKIAAGSCPYDVRGKIAKSTCIPTLSAWSSLVISWTEA